MSAEGQGSSQKPDEAPKGPLYGDRQVGSYTTPDGRTIVHSVDADGAKIVRQFGGNPKIATAEENAERFRAEREAHENDPEYMAKWAPPADAAERPAVPPLPPQPELITAVPWSKTPDKVPPLPDQSKVIGKVPVFDSPLPGQPGGQARVLDGPRSTGSYTTPEGVTKITEVTGDGMRQTRIVGGAGNQVDYNAKAAEVSRRAAAHREAIANADPAYMAQFMPPTQGSVEDAAIREPIVPQNEADRQADIANADRSERARKGMPPPAADLR